MADRGQLRAAWQPTRALPRAASLVGLLLLVAVLLGRIDLVALAVPIALGTVWSLLGRPQTAPTIRIDLPTDTVAEGQPVTVGLTVGSSATLDVATARMSTSRWLGVVEGRTVRSSVVRAGEQVTFDIRVRPLRWGRHSLGPAVLTASACDGLMVCEAQIVAARLLSALPQEVPFDASDVVPRAAGVVGSHRSRRPGQGAELAGVRPFTPGDRLRRIDWRVSLRAQQMYVTATQSERDTDVVLVLDLLHDAGHSGGIDGSASSLDTTVRASAALTEHYLSVGDRVGAVSYGARLRFLRPAGGATQLRRVMQLLLDAESRADGAATSPRLMGPRVLPPRALTVVLSPLVDPSSLTLVAELAHRGQSVVVVDTLPADVRPPKVDAVTDLAWRLWWLQRDADVHALAHVGVPVVRWHGTGSLDLVLREATRAASAGRAR